ncbi:MAG: hypothetical protein KTR13_10005 [Saprospiraceae bacterium]|nr:hypothetical protein [Saprospiraceae bacterium]
MLLVADSGSTKADWKLFDGDKIHEKKMVSKGFNPFFHDKAFILNELNQAERLVAIKDKITKLYFFGAGCSSPDRCEVIAEGLRAFFVNAEVIVDHDMLGAVYSVYTEGEPSIVSILGTGSNSTFYDGDAAHENIPALSYILGDEGSGSYYGKKILASYLYNRLPPKMHRELTEAYGLTKEGIFDRVYNQPHANVYLASFAKFLSDHKEYHYVKRLVYQGMLEFVDIHICGYEGYQNVPAHFIGSIAYFFEDILREVASRRQVKVGTIIKQPIHNLTEYLVKRESELSAAY